MRYFFIYCLLFIAARAASQNNIKGKVVHETSGEVIANASIFVNGSTKGTISKPDGSFELNGVPAGNHELVVSCVGYATLVLPYTASDLPLNLVVQMKPKVAELATVVVEPDAKDGWQRWGKFFTESFIGTTYFSEDCKLKNPEVLRFKFSRKTNILRVVATEPLIIENKALGYTIKYQLEEFSFDHNSRMLIYLGYALFEDIPTNRDGLKRRWEANREKAWNGSIQHFMRSLYLNTLAEDGFEVKRLIKTPNVEKARVREVMQARVKALRAASGGAPIRIDRGDSADYYNRILKQPDEYETVLPALLTADSVIVAANNEKLLFFLDYLYVTYKKEKEEKEYVAFNLERREPYHQRSTVFLPNLTSLIIDSKGNYSPVQEFVSYGYWAWSEKISTMLPLDYAQKFE